MSILALQNAIAARIEADLSRLWGFETPKGGHRPPKVFKGWLPPKRSRPESLDPPDNPGKVSDDFPYVLVLPFSGRDGEEGDEQGATATVLLGLGTYSLDDEGHTDVLLIIDLLRQSLEEQPVVTAPVGDTPRRAGTGAVGQFCGELKTLSWTLGTEQPRPEWIGTITTTWTIPRPVRVDDGA